MPLRSTEQGWGALVRAFHWLIAALIITQGVIGLSMVQMGLTPAKVRVFALHKSIGITILALVLHVGAALWHHFRQRDDVLRRMAFGPRKHGGDAR
jgi:cytochrome b561